MISRSNKIKHIMRYLIYIKQVFLLGIWYIIVITRKSFGEKTEKNKIKDRLYIMNIMMQ